MMKKDIPKETSEKIAHLEKEIQELEAQRKANERKILELTERELQNREFHTAEIHALRWRNFEISFQVITQGNEIKRQRYYPPEE